MIDCYTILGINPEAYWFEVKEAYRKKALFTHPDRGGSDDSFKILQEAYEILSDREKRIQYDIMASPLDTSLRSKTIKANLELSHILDGQPYHISYFKKAECDCKGKLECIYCEGKKIREDEVSISLPHTSQYSDGSTITVQNGGDIDRYGRNAPLAIEIEYKLPKGFRKEGASLVYEAKMTDVEFENILSYNEIKIQIPDWKKVSIPLDNLRNNAYIMGRLIVTFNITITNLKKYFFKNIQQKQKHTT